jgi:tetratricopeptide (TPR) repeat protein
MTGLAIVLYLNQHPTQPRERDYAYSGSFYAFAIWIGLGVYGLYDWLKKVKIPENIKAISVSVICLVAVPVLMASQEWDDHDRSGRYMAREFARNYLESCEKDAILITFGDNDTFPLWYIQEVEGVRPDVRILNFTLSGMHWYVEQLYSKIYDSEKAPFTLPKEYYRMGLNASLVYPTTDQTIELRDALKTFMTDPNTTTFLQNGDSVKVLLYNNFRISSEKDTMTFSIPVDSKQGRQIPRNELMLLDILATNAFKRPIYTMSPSYFAKLIPNINDYVQQEGLVYRITPKPQPGNIALEKTSNLFLNKFQWGGIKDPKTYLEDAVSVNNSRNMRQQHMFIARNFSANGQKDKAIKVLDKALVEFPASKLYFDRYDLQFAEQYCANGELKKGEDIINQIVDLYISHIKYYNGFIGSKARNVASIKNETLQYLAMAYSIAQTYNLTSVINKVKTVPEVQSFLGIQEMQNEYNNLIQKVNTAAQIARSGNKEAASQQFLEILVPLEKILQTQSEELFSRGAELLMFVYSNAMNYQLKAVEDKIMSNPTFSKVINEYARQQQAQMQTQQQGQPNVAVPGVNL